jgi:hypothetical protein
VAFLVVRCWTYADALHGSANALSDQSETSWHGADLNCGLREPPQEILQVSIGSTRLKDALTGLKLPSALPMFGALFERPRFATAVVVCTKFTSDTTLIRPGVRGWLCHARDKAFPRRRSEVDGRAP